MLHLNLLFSYKYITYYTKIFYVSVINPHRRSVAAVAV